VSSMYPWETLEILGEVNIDGGSRQYLRLSVPSLSDTKDWCERCLEGTSSMSIGLVVERGRFTKVLLGFTTSNSSTLLIDGCA